VVPFKITVCGLTELQSHARSGVSHVLSILDPPEPEPPAFFDYDTHHRLELRFHDIIAPQPGFIEPHIGHVERLLAFGREMDVEPAPTHLLVHCHMGISRSSASMMLLLAQARPDVPAAEIAGEVARIRPQAWPNLSLIQMGDAILGRQGALIEATRALYRRRAEEDPQFLEFIRVAGRTAELEGLPER
jgi:predicted protein tyrosine phosphatase